MTQYKVAWLESISDDEETNQINEDTWKQAGFEVNNDGEGYEVVAPITIDMTKNSILSEAQAIMEQYSRNDPDQVFAIIDQDKNTILTEQDLYN